MNKLHLELTMDQLNVVLAGLAKLPLEASLESFTIIRQQAEAQLNQQPSPEDSATD